jgi:hypothetical protein
MGGEITDAQGRRHELFYIMGGPKLFQIISGTTNFPAPFVFAADGFSFEVDGNGPGVSGRWRATRTDPYATSTQPTAEQATLLRVVEGRWRERDGSSLWRLPTAGQDGTIDAFSWQSGQQEAAAAAVRIEPSQDGRTLVGQFGSGARVRIERNSNGQLMLTRPAQGTSPARTTELIKLSAATPAPAPVSQPSGGSTGGGSSVAQLQARYAPWLGQWVYLGGTPFEIKLEGGRLYGNMNNVGVFHIDLSRSDASRLRGTYVHQGDASGDEMELMLNGSGVIYGFLFPGGDIAMPVVFRRPASPGTTSNPVSPDRIREQMAGIWVTPVGELRMTRDGYGFKGSLRGANGHETHQVRVTNVDDNISSLVQRWTIESADGKQHRAEANFEIAGDMLVLGSAYTSDNVKLPGGATHWVLRRQGTAPVEQNETPPVANPPTPRVPNTPPVVTPPGPVVPAAFKPLNRIDVRVDRVVVARGYPTHQVHAFLTVKNTSASPQYFTSGFMKAVLADADGAGWERSQPYRASGEPAALFSSTPVIQPGGELKVRYIFLSEPDAQLRTLTLSEGGQRAEFPVGL